MLNTKYIVLIDDTSELCDIINNLYQKDNDYEFVCTESNKPKVKSALLTVPDLIIINEDGLEEESIVSLTKYIRKNSLCAGLWQI